MARSILVGEVRTGRRIATIPVSDASWSSVLKGTGTVDCTVPLDAAEFKRLEGVTSGQYPGVNIFPSPNTWPRAETTAWHIGQGIRGEFLTMLDPNRCFMALVDGDTIPEAGPISAHGGGEGSSSFTVKANGLRSLFDGRRIMGVIDSGYAAWTVTHSAMSLGTIAKRLVELCLADPDGNLPVILPADVLAADDDDHRRTFKGSELAKVSDRLDQLSGVLNGPDIAFDPRLTSDRMGVEWVMRTGTEADPMLHQAGVPWVFDMRVPRSSIGGLSWSRDGSGMASRSWATSNDAAAGMLMARKDLSALLDANYPLLEIADNRSTVERQATLDGWAAGNLASASAPVMTISIKAMLGSRVVRPGDFAVFYPPADHYLALLRGKDQPYSVRVASTGGSVGDGWTSLKFLPEMGAR